jgi:hypothetical protein
MPLSMSLRRIAASAPPRNSTPCGRMHAAFLVPFMLRTMCSK